MTNLEKICADVLEKAEKATETPWTNDYDKDGCLLDNKGHRIALTNDRDYACFDSSTEGCKRNADYILVACNNAPKLAKIVRVLSEALKRYESNHALIPSHCGPSGTPATADLVPVYNWAKQAIQTAERILK